MHCCNINKSGDFYLVHLVHIDGQQYYVDSAILSFEFSMLPVFVKTSSEHHCTVSVKSGDSIWPSVYQL